MPVGTVIGVEGGSYTLLFEGGREAQATLRGRLKQAPAGADKVVIGDRVEVAEAESGAVTIEALLPRRSTMVRRAAGGRKAKVLAANVDRVFVVVAVEPAPREELVDRLKRLTGALQRPPGPSAVMTQGPGGDVYDDL